jgi:diaminopimelate epimerase
MKLKVTCVSMGNPHAVCFLEQPVNDFPLAEVGPKVEQHPMFPNRVNFEIVNVISRSKLRARVWERGAGETLSCGTGACAIAVAAKLKKLTDNPVDIILPGGTLTVDWDGKGEVLLTGPAEIVFRGEWLG